MRFKVGVQRHILLCHAPSVIFSGLRGPGFDYASYGRRQTNHTATLLDLEGTFPMGLVPFS